MNHFCAAAAILGTNLCENETPISAVEQSFISHMGEHGLSYGTAEEYAFRLSLFQETDAKINASNAHPDNTFVVGHNEFSTMTEEEFSKRLGYSGPQELGDDVEFTELPEALEGGVDWRSKGAVNAVKNQGSCGSCWAFSAMASIEGHFKIQHGALRSFAEQECVDCDRKSNGCHGGWQANCMNLLKGKAIDYENDYKYTAKDGSCKSIRGHAKVSAVNTVRAQSGSALKAAISKGPTSVTVDASPTAFKQYKTGVVNRDCATALNHAIAAVGWGTASGKDFYIVRNSWGSRWGDKGYIKIASTASGKGVCGIQQVSVWPSVNAA